MQWLQPRTMQHGWMQMTQKEQRTTDISFTHTHTRPPLWQYLLPSSFLIERGYGVVLPPYPHRLFKSSSSLSSSTSSSMYSGPQQLPIGPFWAKFSIHNCFSKKDFLYVFCFFPSFWCMLLLITCSRYFIPHQQLFIELTLQFAIRFQWIGS